YSPQEGARAAAKFAGTPPDAECSVAKLRYLNGYSVAAMSDELKVSVCAVRSALQRSKFMDRGSGVISPLTSQTLHCSCGTETESPAMQGFPGFRFLTGHAIPVNWAR